MTAKRAVPAKQAWLEGNIPAPLEFLVTVLMSKLSFDASIEFLNRFTEALEQPGFINHSLQTKVLDISQ